MINLRSNIDTKDLEDVTDKFDVQVFRTKDADFKEDTIILRIRDKDKEGKVDAGFNLGVDNCKKYIEYLDSDQSA